MRQEGIILPEGELGWFLKSKLGLDQLRQQLLETALGGKESYDAVEVEVLRLFKDLHTADPLHQRRGFQDHQNKPPLLQRFLAQGAGSTMSSSRTSMPMSSGSSWASGPRSVRSNSTASSGHRPPFRRPFQQQQQRQSNVTEIDEEDEWVGEEGNGGDDGGDHQAYSLEEVLQAEAEDLANELDQAEKEGLDAELLTDLESGVEQAAESLITMREARGKLAEVRKDRGYGKAPSSTSSSPGKGRPHGNQATARKQSGKHPCWDCLQHGHWAGDPQCPKPGAGLGKKDGGKGGRHVKVVESLNTEHVVEGHEVSVAEVATGSGLASVLLGPQQVHEVAAVQLDRGCSLDEVLKGEQGVYAEVNSANGPSLAWDKKLVGALGSACNRTCTGTTWLANYLKTLRGAPQEIQALVCHEAENETFRFGNGGIQKSMERWRLPTMIGNQLILFWTSVVPVPSLGLLLGRDFLDAVGAVLSFARRALRCDHLDSSVIIPLRQLTAGHFMLPLIPSAWSRPGAQRWRCFGQDGVLELQVSGKDWVTRRLAAQGLVSRSDRMHEHLVTEQSILAADVKFSGLSAEAGSPVDTMVQESLKIPEFFLQHRSRLLQELQVVMESKGPSKCDQKWTRMVVRAAARQIWHAFGQLLWLVRRPSTRYLPYPYPTVGNISAWNLQAQSMVASGALSRRHYRQALHNKAFTVGNLQDCCHLRDRMGVKHAFLEDPISVGMMAARASKGMSSQIKRQAALEAKREAQMMTDGHQRDLAVRELVGPRGGLPSLKKDLMKLASLVNVEFDEKTTVDQLKARIKPVIGDMKGMLSSPQRSSKTSGSSSAEHFEVGTPKRTQGALPAGFSTPTRTAPVEALAPSSPMIIGGVSAEQVEAMMANQEERFQTMLSQVFQHVMNSQQILQQQGIAPMEEEPVEEDFTKDEIAQMNQDHRDYLKEIGSTGRGYISD